jgi:CheY-like chemotaxis protein
VTHSILVVDSDQAFATILKEGLEAPGDYRVSLTHDGSDALESVVERPFDMVIVDMGLQDVKPLTLIKAIREAKPSMRVMVIPLMGQGVPKELEEVNIQGIVPKPFFVDDLPSLLTKAMNADAPASPTPTTPELKVATPSRPAAATKEIPSQPSIVEQAEPSTPTEEAPVPTKTAAEEPSYSPELLAKLQAKERQIVVVLKALNSEVRAESIVVTLGPQLIAFAGLLGEEQAVRLARLAAESTDAASQAAAFLGEPDGRFEQSLHEGAEYRLYSLTLSEGLVLSLALSSEVPLGTLRYRARQAAEELLELLE